MKQDFTGPHYVPRVWIVTVTILLLLSAASAQTQLNTIPVRNSSPALADINNTSINHLVYVALDDGLGNEGLWVHALDGAANPPYSHELPGYPKLILNGTAGMSPTVAVGDVNFSNATQPPGYLSVVVGGDLGTGKQVFAFKCDVLGTTGQCDPDPLGGNVPGFPATAFDPPFFNHMVIRTANVGPTVPPVLVSVDGSSAVISASESTFEHRHNGLGVLRQCQFIANDVWGGPGLGYVGPHGSPLMYDGTPQEAVEGYLNFPDSPYLKVYDSWGKSLDCNGAEDLLSYRGGGAYTSSVVIGDLDGDGIQDMVIANGTTNNLEVYASQQGAQTVQLFSGSPGLGPHQYSSAAIVTFDGIRYDTIIATDDGGYVHALKYDRIAVPHLSERPGWPRYLDNGAPISASPVVAQLQTDANGPQIIVANDAGKVHILRANGTDLVTPFTVGTGSGSQVWSTPVVGTRRVNVTGDTCSTVEPTNCPLIEVLNGKGAWEIVLSGFPPFNPATAQWATFHRSNTRTGALTPDQDGSQQTTQTTYGSIGGLGQGCTSVKLYYDGTENPVPDYYGGNAVATPLSDGRYLFEFVRSADGPYKVRFNDSIDITGVQVNPSLLTMVNQSCQ